MVDHYEGEDVIITFERNGASSVLNVEGKITNINVSGGEETTEVKYAFGNKQVLFGKPKEKFKVEFEVLLSNNSTIFGQAFFGGTSAVAGVTLKSSSSPSLWRIVVWFVPVAEQKSTGTVFVPPKTSDNLGRWIFVDCRSVSFDRSFASDDMLTGTISFEFSSTDADGKANFFEGYTNSTTSVITPMELTTTNVAEYRGLLSWNTTTPAWTGAYVT